MFNILFIHIFYGQFVYLNILLTKFPWYLNILRRFSNCWPPQPPKSLATLNISDWMIMYTGICSYPYTCMYVIWINKQKQKFFGTFQVIGSIKSCLPWTKWGSKRCLPGTNRYTKRCLPGINWDFPPGYEFCSG